MALSALSLIAMAPEPPTRNASCGLAGWEMSEAIVRSISWTRALRTRFRDMIVDARAGPGKGKGEAGPDPEAVCGREGTEELSGGKEGA